MKLVFYSHLVKSIGILFSYLQKERVYNTDETAKNKSNYFFSIPLVRRISNALRFNFQNIKKTFNNSQKVSPF